MGSNEQHKRFAVGELGPERFAMRRQVVMSMRISWKRWVRYLLPLIQMALWFGLIPSKRSPEYTDGIMPAVDRMAHWLVEHGTTLTCEFSTPEAGGGSNL